MKTQNGLKFDGFGKIFCHCWHENVKPYTTFCSTNKIFFKQQILSVKLCSCLHSFLCLFPYMVLKILEILHNYCQLINPNIVAFCVPFSYTNFEDTRDSSKLQSKFCIAAKIPFFDRAPRCHSNTSCRMPENSLRTFSWS